MDWQKLEMNLKMKNITIKWKKDSKIPTTAQPTTHRIWALRYPHKGPRVSSVFSTHVTHVTSSTTRSLATTSLQIRRSDSLRQKLSSACSHTSRPLLPYSVSYHYGGHIIIVIIVIRCLELSVINDQEWLKNTEVQRIF